MITNTDMFRDYITSLLKIGCNRENIKEVYGITEDEISNIEKEVN